MKKREKRMLVLMSAVISSMQQLKKEKIAAVASALFLFFDSSLVCLSSSESARLRDPLCFLPPQCSLLSSPSRLLPLLSLLSLLRFPTHLPPPSLILIFIHPRQVREVPKRNHTKRKEADWMRKKELTMQMLLQLHCMLLRPFLHPLLLLRPLPWLSRLQFRNILHHALLLPVQLLLVLVFLMFMQIHLHSK